MFIGQYAKLFFCILSKTEIKKNKKTTTKKKKKQEKKKKKKKKKTLKNADLRKTLQDIRFLKIIGQIPSSQMTFIQRRINVDATSYARLVVSSSVLTRIFTIPSSLSWFVAFTTVYPLFWQPVQLRTLYTLVCDQRRHGQKPSKH